MRQEAYAFIMIQLYKQATQDYEIAVRNLREKPWDTNLQRKQYEARKFLCSDPYDFFENTDGEEVCYNLWLKAREKGRDKRGRRKRR